jgi:hypothetical protein
MCPDVMLGEAEVDATPPSVIRILRRLEAAAPRLGEFICTKNRKTVPESPSACGNEALRDHCIILTELSNSLSCRDTWLLLLGDCCDGESMVSWRWVGWWWMVAMWVSGDVDSSMSWIFGQVEDLFMPDIPLVMASQMPLLLLFDFSSLLLRRDLFLEPLEDVVAAATGGFR